MDYKQKYKEALERARGLHEQGMMPERIEHIFPELKESKDERIRKEIIQSIQDNMCVIHKEKCIAWLEKQGEQKPVWSEEDEEIFNDIIMCLKGNFKSDKSMINWLKSFKERIKGE